MDDKEQSKQPSEQLDRFSRLMFGPFPPRSYQSHDNPAARTESSSQQDIDFMQIIQNIDTLVASFDQLKPLIKKITSLVDMFKK
jgi:hypothetical protein